MRKLARPSPRSPIEEIRVVLVDDSELGRTLLAQALGNCRGIRIVGQAADGMAGFALAEELRPDLVITDLQMPALNGFDLAEMLRQNYPAMRSIIVSADDSPNHQVASLRHGADAFVSKSRLHEDLLPVLNALFPDDAEPANMLCDA